MEHPKKELPIFTVDSFTKVPFSGNPAAVCLLRTDLDLSDELKSKVAAEMNLSETAFVFCLKSEDSFEKSQTFGLRWFTPTTEVDLCGHATIASAAILFHVCGNVHKELRFETRSGTLLAINRGDSIALDFPQNPPQPLSDPDDLKDLQSLIELSCGSLGPDSVQEVYLSKVTRKLLVRLKDTVTMSDLSTCVVLPDHFLAAYSGRDVRGIILTVKGSEINGCVDADGAVFDFISRYFAPWWGIPEDPVTGSAHTVLGPYWAHKLGKSMLYARQCSKRGGNLLLSVNPNNRIEIAGHSCIVMKGKLEI